MKIAIVTGASSGLGTEFAKTISKKCRKLDEIWVIARRRDRLEALAEEIRDIKVRPVPLDLTDRNSYDELKKLLKAEKPDVRVLINNAGYCGCGAFEDMSEREIDTMIMLNDYALTMLNKCVFPYMHNGSIAILTCSVSSFAPIPYQAVYSASKAYVRFLGYALHREMKKRGVNVLTLCPGNMDTEMNVKGDSEKSKAGNLPYLDMKKITAAALQKARNGYGFYTPGLFYKGYRLLANILPQSVMMNFTGGFFDKE